jgi:hypothetical protein
MIKNKESETNWEVIGSDQAQNRDSTTQQLFITESVSSQLP